MERSTSIAMLFGRVFLSLIFVMSGIYKLTAWNQTADMMEREGIVAVPVMLAAAVILELGGGLSVLLGLRPRIGAVALICFLIPVTLIIHDFWNYTGQQQQTELTNFMKNTAVLGGLCLLLGAGGGGCCQLDSYIAKKRTSSSAAPK